MHFPHKRIIAARQIHSRPKLDIKHLRHILALAEEKNFARAAARVHLSQPAFSRSIQAAEQSLQLILFDRDAPELRPTPAGEFVLSHARKIVFDTRCLERDVALYREHSVGSVSIGAGPFPAATILPTLMTEIRRQYPAVKLHVEVNNWANLLERLRREELDFFVADTSELPHAQQLDIQSLGKQYGGLYVRAQHPLASQSQITLSDLRQYGLASVRIPPKARRQLMQLFKLRSEGDLPLSLECDDVATLKQVCLGSDTILAVVKAAVSEEVVRGQVHAVQLRGAVDLYSELGIVSLHGRSHSPIAIHLCRRLMELAQSLNEKP